MDGSGNTKITAFHCPSCGAAVAPDSPSCPYCRSALAVRVCASCFGAVAIGMKHCPFCGAKMDPAVPQKPGSLQCPRCKTGLAPATVGRHSLQICTRCGGIWVDKDSFQVICTQEEDQEAVLGFQSKTDDSPVTSSSKPQRAYIPCPECGKLMNHKNFSGCSGIVLDWCRDHGSWFDRQELQRIVSFIRNGGLRKARERDRARLREQEEQSRIKQIENAAHPIQTDTGFRDLFGETQGGDPLLQLFSRMFLRS